MNYNLVIAGGGTAGCAAAYIAAKNGLKTLLIEKNTYLGGTMTGALVTPAMKTLNSKINMEFFNEFVSTLKKIGGQITYTDGNEGWFNPELSKIVLDEMLSAAGVNILFDAQVTDITLSGRKICALKVGTPAINTKILSTYIEPVAKNTSFYNSLLSEHIETIYYDNYPVEPNILSEYIETDYVLDATASQIICKNLNCRFINDNDNKQPSSLRFIASGVDLSKFLPFILEFDKDRTATTGGYINGEIHLSTACTWDKEWALTPLFNQGIDKGILKEQDKAYFQIFTIPGMPQSVAFNCPRFSECADTSNTYTNSRLIIEARKAIVRILNFCKASFPGFKNAYISSIAPMVGVRTSQRALGRYFYTVDDLKNGKKFEHPVLISNYPVDVHSDKKEGAKLEKVLKEYQLPLEALMSADYENLFFAGRSVSCDFYSQAALRIIPSCFSMGEGIAKYIAGLSN